jgi:hypothetical protein
MKAALRVAVLFGMAAAASAGEGRWSFAGPPGRVSAIAVDIDGRLFAVTAQGMWRSVDGGAAWELVDTRLGSSVIRSMAGDPRQPGTVMAVGCGGYETADGGEHWFPVPGLSPADCSFDALQSDATQVEGFFASGSAGLFRTRFGSGGIEWAPLGQDRFTGKTYATANATFPRTIYAAPVSGGLFVSRDGGLTWSTGAAPPAPIRQLQGSSGAIATTDSGSFFTFDGTSWQDISGALAGAEIRFLAIPFEGVATNDNRVSYAATSTGVFRLRAGWEPFSDALPAGGARAVLASRSGRTVYALPDAGEGMFSFRYPHPTLRVDSPPASVSSTSAPTIRVRLDPPQPVRVPLEVTSSDESVLLTGVVSVTADPLAAEVVVPIYPVRADLSPVTIMIRVPPDLGGASVAIPIQVLNPRPVIGSLQPRAVVAGAAAFKLYIGDRFRQSTFAPGIQAYWNGSPRPTRFVPIVACPGFCPPPVLEISISAEDIASDGTAVVTVVNPPPGGGAADSFQVVVAAAFPREAIPPDHSGARNRGTQPLPPRERTESRAPNRAEPLPPERRPRART